MRKIKASSNYLKNQTRKNLAKAVLCVLVFLLIFSVVMYRAISRFEWDMLAWVGLVFLFVPIVAFCYYLRKYRIFSGGWAGEKQVAQHLNSTLSDDYYLINDLYLREGGGDIDHVVLTPGGIFVLETKNWSGNITSSGDEWHRKGKRNFNSSPSRQVKRNVQKIQRIIGSSPVLRSMGIWVEGIVVLTNRHASVHLTNPSVPVLKLQQLPSYITSRGSPRRFSREQLEAIGKEITKQKA
ncbi:MAG: NERD domain-containing protein [Nitrososphaerota archaeon]|jgi:hypothetical protein|nr:NERD domain-containing protein [Nitrososphaerota archaeon]